MNIPKSTALLYDQFGNTVTPSQRLSTGLIKKQAMGLFGNMYSFPEYGNFRPRFYTLSDTEQGLDSLSRELLVKWSREMFGQLSFVSVAANLKANFCVGNEYIPRYTGAKARWGKKAEDWLVNSFYKNCCTRGPSYDFQTSLHLLSFLLDQDGDILNVFTRDEFNNPKFQMICSHRLRTMNPGQKINEGRFAGTYCYDGIIYDSKGKTLGYNVVEPSDINQLTQTVSSIPVKDRQLSTGEAKLIFDPKFFDKSRGLPAISSAILQAISMQELYSYLQEKIKLESCVGLIEKTPSGEAPLEYAQVLQQLNQQQTDFGGFLPSPTTHGVQIINGPSVRYVKAEGGELTTLQSNSPPTQTMEFIKKLETQILSTLGVPHQLIYSPGEISGRIVSGVVEGFRAAIKQRQNILNKYSKLIVGWAVACAMEEGILDKNDEPVYNVFEFTLPKQFSMDEGFDRASDLKDYAAGIITLEDIAQKKNTSAMKIMAQREIEAATLLQAAQRIAKQTGLDFNICLSALRENLVKVSSNLIDPEQLANSTPQEKI